MPYVVTKYSRRLLIISAKAGFKQVPVLTYSSLQGKMQCVQCRLPSAATTTSGLGKKTDERTETRLEKKPSSNHLKKSLKTAQNGWKRLQIETGSGDLFDDGFLAGLGRKLIERIQTGSRLKKKTSLKPAKNSAYGQKLLKNTHQKT